MLNKERPFKRVFEQYKEEPDPMVWQSIKSDLIRKNKRRGAWIWIVAASIFVLSLSGVIYLQENEHSARLKAIAEVENVTHVSSSLKDTSENKLVVQTPAETAKNGAPEADRTPQGSDASSVVECQKPVKLEPVSVDVLDAISGEIHEDGIQSLQFIRLTPFQGVLKFADDRVVKSYCSMLRTRYFVEAALGFGNTSFTGLRNDRSGTTLNALNVGLRLVRESRDLEWSLGLNYGYSSSKLTHRAELENIFVDSMLVKKRYTNETRYYYYDDTSYMSINQSYTNTIHTIRLPMSLSKKWRHNSRMQSYARVGVSFDYLFGTRLNTNFNSNSGVRLERTPDQKSFSRFGAGMGGGLGLIYAVSPKLQVSIGVETSMQFIGLRSSSGLVNPYSTLCSIGIRKLFYSHATN